MATSTATTATTRTTWKLDPVHTLVQFSAKHMMITTVRGRFTDVAGTIEMDEANPAASSVEATIKAASIDTRTEDRDKHLLSADFLDTEHHPEITFRSTKVEPLGANRFKLTGDLTIHGVTRPVVLDVKQEGRVKDPWGGERVGFSASTRIDRRDFGLQWNVALETGGILVGNEISITVDVEAIRQ